MKNVSVVVAVYNTAPYLKQCLDSLVHQTLTDLEIIVVDDGSTDESLSILRTYEAKFPHIIKVLTQKNAGQGAARNHALSYVQGEYISFVDSDDWIALNTYEMAYGEAIAHNYDIVFWDLEWVYDTGAVQIHNTFSNVSEDLNHIGYMLSDPSPCNKLIRTSIIKDHELYFPETCWYEDMAIVPAYIKYIQKMKYIHQPFYKYRQRSNSTMLQKQYSKKLLDIIPAMEYLYNKMEGCYQEEMEYLYSFQLLYFASFRFMEFNTYEDIKACYKELISKYPKYKENKYFKQKPFLFRWYCSLLANEHYQAAKMLIKLRKIIAKETS